MPLHHDPVRHDARFEIATDKPQHPLVPDALLQPSHEHIVAHAVEEFFEIHVHHDPFPFLHVPLRLTDGVMRIASRSEPVTVLREGGVEHRLQHL